MSDWYDYLDPRFALPRAQIKTRDRVVTLCPECGDTNVVTLNNLKIRLKKDPVYACRSCTCRKSALKARKAYKQTMLDKYGVDNPMKDKGVRAKAKATREERIV